MRSDEELASHTQHCVMQDEIPVFTESQIDGSSQKYVECVKLLQYILYIMKMMKHVSTGPEADQDR